jgi:hypothetical protein
MSEYPSRRRKRRSWEPEPQPPKPWHEQAADALARHGYRAVTATPEQVTARLAAGGSFTLTAGWRFEHRASSGEVVLSRVVNCGMDGFDDLLRSYASSKQGESGDDWPGLY